jgi:hypothetical protein
MAVVLSEKNAADFFGVADLPFVVIFISTPLCEHQGKSAVAHQEVVSRVAERKKRGYWSV